MNKEGNEEILINLFRHHYLLFAALAAGCFGGFNFLVDIAIQDGSS